MTDVREIVRDTLNGGGSAAANSSAAADPSAATRPALDARQIVQRDARALRAILARWSTLAQQDDATRALVSEQTEVLLREVQRLVEEL